MGDLSGAEETLTQSAETVRLAVEVMTENGDAIDWQRISEFLADAGLDLEKLRHTLQTLRCHTVS